MSKFIIFEFRCQDDVCAHKFDDLVKPDVYEAPCPKCGANGTRLLSAGRLDPKMGLDPSMPTAYDAWERKNRQKTAQDKKFYEAHGVDKKHHSYGS